MSTPLHLTWSPWGAAARAGEVTFAVNVYLRHFLSFLSVNVPGRLVVLLVRGLKEVEVTVTASAQFVKTS